MAKHLRKDREKEKENGAQEEGPGPEAGFYHSGQDEQELAFVGDASVVPNKDR